jgi:[ribosomal protein S18]-alanine N-acetyltransferase
MTITVRKGGASSIAAIIPVMNAAFDPEFGEAWNSGQCMGVMCMPGATLLLGFDGDALCGFALARTVFAETELLLLATDPAHRRTGVATTILNSLVEQFDDMIKHKIYLEVRDGNAAIDFYKNYGFIKVGERKNYYKTASGLFYNAITMALDLDNTQ